MNKRLNYLVDGNSKEQKFFKDYLQPVGIFCFKSSRNIRSVLSIDDAMRTGYVWDYGPFEYWDLLGLIKVLNL